jgi:hypothetical protein
VEPGAPDATVGSRTRPGTGIHDQNDRTVIQGTTPSLLYLIAKNADAEGFFLIWDRPDQNIDFTEDVYEAIAQEALTAGLKSTYHVYARLYVFQTENVRFYQIPDRILADFGLSLSSEPFHEIVG